MDDFQKEFIKDIRAKFQDPDTRKIFFDLMAREIQLQETIKINNVITMAKAVDILRAEFNEAMKKYEETK